MNPLLLLAAEGGYQEFTLDSGGKLVLLFSAVTALIALAVGFFLAKGSWPPTRAPPR